MGNCDSKICESSDTTVEADPDVAGIGVRTFIIQALELGIASLTVAEGLIAFTASSVLALIAILWGYLTDSLPDSTLTEFDHYILSRVKRWGLYRLAYVQRIPAIIEDHSWVVEFGLRTDRSGCYESGLIFKLGC